MRSISELMQPWGYLNWPNRITLARLLLVAPFVMLMQRQQEQAAYRYVALGVFLVMALSDVADGYLAKRLNLKTRLGAILDPVADKTLITCTAVLLSLPHSCIKDTPLPGWVVVMIVGKDVWMVAGFVVLFLLTSEARPAPNRAGRFCTASQFMMVSAVLISPELNRIGYQIGSHLAKGLWWITAAACLWATISYTRVGLAILAESEPASSDSHADKAA